METPRTRIELCGRLLVEIDGERLEGALPGRQGRLLFAYLVLNRGRPVRRDELVEALWAEDGQPASGDALLRPPLSRLRKALGPGRLEGRGELTLLLPEGAYVDWEEAHAALARTRSALREGDLGAAWEAASGAAAIAERGLLPGLEADWIEERRRELADLRVEALEAAAGAGAALGGATLPEAERAARAAVEAAPFRESARAALMEVLRAGGNVAEALRVYEELRTVLRDELGATPSARVMALHERLLRDDEPPAAGAGAAAPSVPAARGSAAAAAPSGPAAPAGAPPAPRAAATPSGPPIVERHNEVLLIGDLLADAAAGSGRVALIEGPAGIGKSRLLVEARRAAAEQGVGALAARGSELEREFPFGVVRQLFEAAVADPSQRERLFTGAAAPALAVFESPAEAPGGDGPTDASFAALHALFWLAVNLTADAPLLLAIDDLHWVDRPSLRFVAYLTRRLEGLPIAIATTLRTGEPAADAALLAEVTQDNATAPVRPRPLTEAAVATIVRDRLGEHAESAFCVACHRATVGNPLLLRQLLTALEADAIEPDAAHAHVVREIGQGAVSRSVLLRLSRLGEEPTAVARAVAVLGESADLPAIGALARIDEERVAAASAALARAEILLPERPLGFVHPLVRDAVYHDLPLGERELQHGRAARILADTGAPPEQVAAHLLAVPRRGEQWVAELLLEAAHGAMRKGAPESAVAYLRRALDEPPPAEVTPRIQFELGLAEMLTRGPAAVEHLEAAYEALEDPVQRAGVAVVLGRALLFTGRPREGMDLAWAAAQALPPEAADLREQMEAFDRSTIWFGVRPPSDLEKLVPHRAPGPFATVGAKMQAAIAAMGWIYSGGPAEECAELALSALEGGDLIATDNGLLAFGATSTLVLADRPEALEASNVQMADAFQRGSLFSMSGIHLWRGFLHLRRGELPEAEEMLRTAFESHERWGYGPVAHVYTSGFFCSTMIARGDLEAARRGLERSDDPGIVSDGARWWLEGKVELLVAEERYEEAIECSLELERRFPHWNYPPGSLWRGFRALALHALGRADEAAAVAAGELELARASGAPGGLGRALRIAGTVRGDDGFAHLWEALDVLDGSTSRLEHARALAALGAQLRRSGLAAEAHDHLTRALELAEVLSAGSVASFARSELVASGVEPSVERPSGVRALTDTQRRVAALAASGQSEREIAQAMFVTPSAVDYQLGDVYRKLGVSSRDELALALERG
jgi:DNA-binding SARP family transcriptional activator/DNA-binding CsgD family transcriptional regulator